MSRLCYVIPYVDFACSEHFINRLHYLANTHESITVLSYDGSYLWRLEEFCILHGHVFWRLANDVFPHHLSIQNVPFLLSAAILQRLEKDSFAEIIFADLAGGGFHCIQSKRMGISFNDTQLTVEMFGSSQYIGELSEDWGHGGFEQLMVQYMERYCVQHCDLLLASTESMMNWAEEKRWVLCKSKAILPCMPIECLDINKYAKPSNTIIFCGPLGVSSNLPMFINAMRRALQSNGFDEAYRILFVGEYKMIEGLPSNQYIQRELNGYNIHWEVMGALDARELILLAVKEQAVLAFCGAMSTLPVELLTAVQYGIPIMAASNPAHQELFHPDTLFPLTPAGIMKVLMKRDYAKPYVIPLLKEKAPSVFSQSTVESDSNCVEPLISIITAYFNHGKYLDIVQQSIEKQTYKNFEWIVIDDCSTDGFSIQKFAEYKEKYSRYPYKFLKADTNRGPGAARNLGVSHAKGEYLVFFDSDNIAKPEMLQQLLNSIRYSGCDCLSCYFDTFEGEGSANKKTLTGMTSAMLGPCLELGLFMNVFGDVNFIVKREAFDAVGGFSTRRIVIEDWQFLATLAYKGYDVDVIAKPLFWYRVLPQSNNSYGSEYIKQRQIIENCCENLPPFVYHLAASFCRPMLEERHPPHIISDSERIFGRVLHLFSWFLPKGSKRRQLAKRLIKRICRIK